MRDIEQEKQDLELIKSPIDEIAKNHLKRYALATDFQRLIEELNTQRALFKGLLDKTDEQERAKEKEKFEILIQKFRSGSKDFSETEQELLVKASGVPKSPMMGFKPWYMLNQRSIPEDRIREVIAEVIENKYQISSEAEKCLLIRASQIDPENYTPTPEDLTIDPELDFDKWLQENKINLSPHKITLAQMEQEKLLIEIEGSPMKGVLIIEKPEDLGLDSFYKSSLQSEGSQNIGQKIMVRYFEVVFDEIRTSLITEWFHKLKPCDQEIITELSERIPDKSPDQDLLESLQRDIGKYPTIDSWIKDQISPEQLLTDKKTFKKKSDSSSYHETVANIFGKFDFSLKVVQSENQDALIQKTFYQIYIDIIKQRLSEISKAKSGLDQEDFAKALRKSSTDFAKYFHHEIILPKSGNKSKSLFSVAETSSENFIFNFSIELISGKIESFELSATEDLVVKADAFEEAIAVIKQEATDHQLQAQELELATDAAIEGFQFQYLNIKEASSVAEEQVDEEESKTTEPKGLSIEDALLKRMGQNNLARPALKSSKVKEVNEFDIILCFAYLYLKTDHKFLSDRYKASNKQYSSFDLITKLKRFLSTEADFTIVLKFYNRIAHAMKFLDVETQKIFEHAYAPLLKSIPANAKSDTTFAYALKALNYIIIFNLQETKHPRFEGLTATQITITHLDSERLSYKSSHQYSILEQKKFFFDAKNLNHLFHILTLDEEKDLKDHFHYFPTSAIGSSPEFNFDKIGKEIAKSAADKTTVRKRANEAYEKLQNFADQKSLSVPVMIHSLFELFDQDNYLNISKTNIFHPDNTIEDLDAEIQYLQDFLRSYFKDKLPEYIDQIDLHFKQNFSRVIVTDIIKSINTIREKIKDNLEFIRGLEKSYRNSEPLRFHDFERIVAASATEFANEIPFLPLHSSCHQIQEYKEKRETRAKSKRSHEKQELARNTIELSRIPEAIDGMSRFCSTIADLIEEQLRTNQTAEIDKKIQTIKDFSQFTDSKLDVSKFSERLFEELEQLIIKQKGFILKTLTEKIKSYLFGFESVSDPANPEFKDRLDALKSLYENMQKKTGLNTFQKLSFLNAGLTSISVDDFEIISSAILSKIDDVDRFRVLEEQASATKTKLKVVSKQKEELVREKQDLTEKVVSLQEQIAQISSQTSDEQHHKKVTFSPSPKKLRSVATPSKLTPKTAEDNLLRAELSSEYTKAARFLVNEVLLTLQFKLSTQQNDQLTTNIALALQKEISERNEQNVNNLTALFSRQLSQYTGAQRFNFDPAKKIIQKFFEEQSTLQDHEYSKPLQSQRRFQHPVTDQACQTSSEISVAHMVQQAKTYNSYGTKPRQAHSEILEPFKMRQFLDGKKSYAYYTVIAKTLFISIKDQYLITNQRKLLQKCQFFVQNIKENKWQEMTKKSNFLDHFTPEEQTVIAEIEKFINDNPNALMLKASKQQPILLRWVQETFNKNIDQLLNIFPEATLSVSPSNSHTSLSSGGSLGSGRNLFPEFGTRASSSQDDMKLLPNKFTEREITAREWRPAEVSRSGGI